MIYEFGVGDAEHRHKAMQQRLGRAVVARDDLHRPASLSI
jgi:hypothetical protein